MDVVVYITLNACTAQVIVSYRFNEKTNLRPPGRQANIGLYVRCTNSKGLIQ